MKLWTGPQSAKYLDFQHNIANEVIYGANEIHINGSTGTKRRGSDFQIQITKNELIKILAEMVAREESDEDNC